MKKYLSSEFVATKYGIYKAAQDIITGFPSTIIANGSNASATIKGNMQQAGTPTPAAPIYPTECGDLSSGNYVIPVGSGGVTTNIDLGAVQSTRTIRKLILTGTEAGYAIIDTDNHIFTIRGIFNSAPQLLQVGGVCTHYKYNNTVSSLSTNMNNGDFVLNKVGNDYSFTIKDNDFNVGADFKNYLAQQYANETPVMVWYVLETETTGILDEPIRKIGTYVDSVSVSAIPTTAGSQAFNIDTTLKPSEVDLTYTGWHMYDDKKYSGGVWG